MWLLRRDLGPVAAFRLSRGRLAVLKDAEVRIGRLPIVLAAGCPSGDAAHGDEYGGERTANHRRDPLGVSGWKTRARG